VRFYANENFPRQAVDALRVLGHDVLTTEEAAKASLSDPDVLKYASENVRIVLTYNRKDFTHASRVDCPADHDGST
jgi:predicted nuclease of predicted toxin-antitoxin system